MSHPPHIAKGMNFGSSWCAPWIKMKWSKNGSPPYRREKGDFLITLGLFTLRTVCSDVENKKTFAANVKVVE